LAGACFFSSWVLSDLQFFFGPVIISMTSLCAGLQERNIELVQRSEYEDMAGITARWVKGQGGGKILKEDVMSEV
jgi:hypothetical protein